MSGSGYSSCEDVIFDMDGEETTPTVQLHELKCMLMELITKVDASNKMLRVLYQHQHHKNQTKNNRRKRATFRDYFPIKSIEMWDEVNERLETDEVFTSRLISQMKIDYATTLLAKQNRLKKFINVDTLIMGNWSGICGKRMLKNDRFIMTLYNAWKSDDFVEEDFKDFIKKITLRGNHAYRSRKRRRMAVSPVFITTNDTQIKEDRGSDEG